MTWWSTIGAAVDAAKKRTIDAVLDSVAEGKARRDGAAFSTALIALSAKMARADGVVTDDEIAAFQDFFSFEEKDADRVRMLYRLAQEDVAGFEYYLQRVARLFRDQPIVLEDVLDCLYHIAAADGVAHPAELAMLDTAAEVFALPECAVRRLKSVHLGVGEDDPYAILGIGVDASDEEIKQVYRRLAKENHPDALIARGVPSGLVSIAEGRLAAINSAYETIASARRGLG
ncbi:MAG: molecular chaperone DjiA [Pseudomonadota bacterium]